MKSTPAHSSGSSCWRASASADGFEISESSKLFRKLPLADEKIAKNIPSRPKSMFLNIFVEKIGVFAAKHCGILQKLDHNIGFLKKNADFFAEN
jgi:hypothetical protein